MTADGRSTADDVSTSPDDDSGKHGGRGTRAAVRRWLPLLTPLVVPWVVVRTTATTLVFPWGMLWLEGGSVVALPQYLGGTAGLPRYLRMWPIGTGCYALALAWAGAGRFGADQRVTAGLLALAGVTAIELSMGSNVDPNRTAVPAGVILLFGLAVWTYVGSEDRP